MNSKSQKTLDKQTATFLGVLAQNIPQLSGDEMQHFIEHPASLQSCLEYLENHNRILIDEVIQEYFPNLYAQLNFIVPKVGWDFLIMQSEVYPEVGFSVSRRRRSLDQGFLLRFGGFEFWTPCACCSHCWKDGWIGEEKSPMLLITRACSLHNIKYLLLARWERMDTRAMIQGNYRCRLSEGEKEALFSEVKLIDPIQSAQMKVLNKERFQQAFGVEGVCFGYNGVFMPLSCLLD